MNEKNTDIIAKQIKAFFSQFPSRQFSEGHIIVDPGDDPPGIMYIEKGVIGQFDIAKNGSKIGITITDPQFESFAPVGIGGESIPCRGAQGGPPVGLDRHGQCSLFHRSTS